MSGTSNAIKTGLFTLLVPLVAGVWTPQRMASEPIGGVAVPVWSRVAC